MSETALVTILMSVGIRQRRAAAFERFLDDKAPYGFHADLLAALMIRYAERENVQMQFRDLMEGGVMPKANPKKVAKEGVRA